MGKREDQTHIHRPRSLRELAAIIKEFPGIQFVAGGTDIMRKLAGNPRFMLPSAVVALEDVEDLVRIKRRENSIEIGACVSLERIISLGTNVVPPILIMVLSRIAGPSVRNVATLGGNIVLASPFADAALPLLLLDARSELRRMGAHVWVPLSRLLRSPQKQSLAPSELLATISIPILPFNIHMYEKLDIITHPVLSLLKFGAAARVYRNTVTDFRMVFGGVDPLYARNREIEAMVIGSKVPFPEKLAIQFTERLADFLGRFGPSFLPDDYNRRSAIRLAESFLEKTSSFRGQER